jgi:hypothetical protein
MCAWEGCDATCPIGNKPLGWVNLLTWPLRRELGPSHDAPGLEGGKYRYGRSRLSSLMLPVLKQAAHGETRVLDVADKVADELGLTAAERDQLLPTLLRLSKRGRADSRRSRSAGS